MPSDLIFFFKMPRPPGPRTTQKNSGPPGTEAGHITNGPPVGQRRVTPQSLSSFSFIICQSEILGQPISELHYWCPFYVSFFFIFLPFPFSSFFLLCMITVSINSPLKHLNIVSTLSHPGTGGAHSYTKNIYIYFLYIYP